MPFVLLDAQFHTGVMLGLAQNISAFNAASRGCIVLRDARIPGQYVNNLLWDMSQDVWTDRNPASVAAIASGDRRALNEVNMRGVIVPIKAFVTNSVGDLARSIGQNAPQTAEAFSQMVGQWVGVTKLKRQLNDGLRAARAALNQGASTITVAGGSNGGKANSADLIRARAVMGDIDFAQTGVLVMHSKPYYDLVGDQVAAKIPDVSGFNLFQGTAATYGIPTLVIDSPSLVGIRGSGSAAVPEYYSLGLVPEAVTLLNNTAETAVVQPRTGLENLVYDVQAQADHSVHVKGFAWDVNNGGAAPDQAKLGTGTNWDPYTSETKLRAGFCMVSL